MDGKKLTTVQVKKLLNGNKETFSLKCGLFQTYLFVCLPVGGSELGFGGLEYKM